MSTATPSTFANSRAIVVRIAGVLALGFSLALPGSAVHAQPQITSVSGCTDDGPATIDCPAAGGTRLTVVGANFGVSGATARVGLSDCTNPSNLSDSMFACDAPPGSGERLGVQVIDALGVASAPAPLFSYAAPVITSVEGCPGGNTDCNRAGGQVLTIRGANFGTGQPRVLVDSNACTAAAAVSDQEAQCVSPAGSGDSLPVLLLSSAGSLSTNAGLLSYEPCLPGTMVSGNTCVACPQGRFSATENAQVCTPCPPGTVAGGVGSSMCEECGAGTFQGSSGRTICDDCPAGTTSERGAAECDGRDAMQCWKVKDLKAPKFVSIRGVSIGDEVSTASPVDVKKPALACLPADVEAAGILDPSDYSCCYKISGAKLDPPATIDVASDIAGPLRFELKKRDLYCEPCSITAP